MKNHILAFILENTFTSFADWYEAYDEYGADEANVVMQNHDWLAWMDDTRDTVVGLDFDDEIAVKITLINSIDPELSMLDISKRIKGIIHDLYLRGEIGMYDVEYTSNGLTGELVDYYSE